MFSIVSSQQTVLVLPSCSGDPSGLWGYAAFLKRHANLHVHLLREEMLTKGASGKEVGDPLFEVLQRFAQIQAIGLLLADWGQDSGYLDRLLDYATKMNVPAIFLHKPDIQLARRILVATAGGPHILQHMWVAREISETLQVPIKVVRVFDAAQQVCPVEQVASKRASCMQQWTSRLWGISEMEDMASDDLAAGVVRCVKRGDLLVMGAPSPYYNAGHFEDSVPFQVARLTDAPMLMMYAKRPQYAPLRSFFWGRLIQTGIRSGSQREIIERLVSALVWHNQAPPSAIPDLVERAIRREKHMSTAVDYQTAFPHIHLPGFRGLAGSMGICREGLPYGGPGQELIHFFFLFITSDGFYDEYLAMLGKIARRMMCPGVREALLKAESSSEVLDVLEPR